VPGRKRPGTGKFLKKGAHRVEKLYRLEHVMTRALETIITLFFFVILGITIALVILRYGFNAAIVGGNEAMNYLFIYTTSLGAAVSISNGEHIKITFFVDKLKAVPRRFVNIVNYLLIAFINGVMFRYSLPWIQSTGYFESPVLRIPNWIVQVSVPIGCGLVILYCLSHVIQEIFNGRPVPDGDRP
jgi:TRAP-type C4-dicarboxylate transport system permease small subunit